MDDVLRQVVHIYAEEVKEQAQSIAQALMAMEGDSSTVAGRIEELFRQAHSLKGSSASLAVTDLEQLAHTLETALLPIRRGQTPLSRELADAGLRAMDAARLRADGLVADGDEGKREVAEATAALARLCTAQEAIAETMAWVEAAAEAEAAVAEPLGGAPAVEESVRVPSAMIVEIERRLDELRTLRGRLEERGAQLAQAAKGLEKMWRAAQLDGRREADELYQGVRNLVALRLGLRDDVELAQANTSDLDDNLRSLRMVPAALLAEPLQRAVRDACRRSDKQAQVALTGSEVKIDRHVLELAKNPLLHLVRNAVDHGVEPPAVREAIGKPSRATIAVAFEQRGSDLVITVRDDGRGVDVELVREKAVVAGLVGPSEAAALDERAVLDLLFTPGFSTVSEVTALSGRGVGLDVVRDAMFRVQGRVELTSEVGRGTTCLLAMPLTVVASEGMLIEERGRRYALPLTAVERIVRVRENQLRHAVGRAFFDDGQPVPVVPLARMLGLGERTGGAAHRILAIVRAGNGRAAVECERLLGEASLVLRALPPELQGIKLLHTAAILPNGQAIFVLSPRAVVAAAVEKEDAPAPAVDKARPATILVADDSITTRSLLRTALEASGFRVRTAADGDEALRLALAEPFDLVVSDVRMPRLDGFGLTARLRADPRTSKLPVVLFSSLDSAEDARRGADSGANAYLTKGAFDRGRLLDVVSDLMGRA